MFNYENAKKLMKENSITASKLSAITEIGKSSLSQYLSGKHEPSAERVEAIATALGCTPDDLFTTASVAIQTSTPPTTDNQPSLDVNMTCHEAAVLMHKHDSFVRRGLQQGVLPFGYAVKGKGNKYSYFISSQKFTEFTGIRV